MAEALTTPEPNPLRGIGLKVASVAVFMAMSTCIKAVGLAVPTGEVVFFRSFFAIPVILAWLWWIGDLAHGLVRLGVPAVRSRRIIDAAIETLAPAEITEANVLRRAVASI